LILAKNLSLATIWQWNANEKMDLAILYNFSLFKLGLSDESEEEEEESEGGDGSRWEEKRRNQGSNFTH
jgi:hypothetical protein